MKQIVRPFLSLFFFITCLNLSAQELHNAVALDNGSVWVNVPPSYTPNSERSNYQNYSPDALIDQSSRLWCSKEGASFPFVFEIELSEAHILQELQFDTRVENYEGISAKNIKVEFSADGKTYPVSKEFTLTQQSTNRFTLNDIEARRVRLIILSNYGHSKYVEIAEFKALGKPRDYDIETIDIHGLWETNWQLITFKQDNNTFTATYSYDKKDAGKISGRAYNGKITRNKLEFKWEEGQLKGSAVLYMNAEGNLLSGRWWNDNRSDDYGLWIMNRKNPTPIVVKKKEESKTDEPKQESIQFGEEKVEMGKKIVMENLLFQQSKAVLVPGSEKELDKLVDLLKKNSSVNVEISGHTDNVGNPDLNLQLSEKRVQMVKNYLIQKKEFP